MLNKSIKDIKFITIGEILLRLSPPNYEKIRTASSFNIIYGGAEANVAAALANLGVDSTFFTVLPDNSVGRAALRYLRTNDVHMSKAIYAGDRLGIYYLEEGFAVRSSKVIYDRAGSSFATHDYSDVDVKELLTGFDWLHLSGITPALGPNCRELVKRTLVAAKELGMTVSFDGNYRKSLWEWQEARDCITEYLPYVDVLIGIEPINLPGPDGVDMKDGMSMQPDYKEQNRIFKELAKRYDFKAIGRHVRYVHSGSENSLKAYLWYDGETWESRTFRFNILDRVGGGDAFSSGLIYAIMEQMDPNDIVNFAVSSSVIKHTIHGDFNITDDKNAILRLMNQEFEVRR
ncbi:MAG: sugar kinase [Lachnospiraceae bacterium]|nr:sugar kinase [Lachnospiraceae bacterium]